MFYVLVTGHCVSLFLMLLAADACEINNVHKHAQVENLICCMCNNSRIRELGMRNFARHELMHVRVCTSALRDSIQNSVVRAVVHNLRIRN